MRADYYTYPAFLYYEKEGISIEFPDLPGCCPCATTTEEAFRNGREALGVHLFGMERDHDPIPEPTPVNELHPDDGAVLAMFEVFMPAVRERMNNKVIKKTLTIPMWLNAAALERSINFSQVLQDALKAQLRIN